MSLDNPLLMLSQLMVGLIGTAVFIYGKKQQSLRCLGVGAAVCASPLVVASALTLWGVTLACLGGLYLWSRMAEA